MMMRDEISGRDYENPSCEFATPDRIVDSHYRREQPSREPLATPTGAGVCGVADTHALGAGPFASIPYSARRG